MAKLTRYLQKIFANNSNQVGVFGTGVDKETSKNVETLQSADYENGWSSAIITNKNYPIWQERDGVDYGLSYQIKYLDQMGIPEWLSTETYYTTSYCQYNGLIYRSKVNDNLNHVPQENAYSDYWQCLGRDFLNTREISNCILEAPCNKITISDGTATLASGATLIFPYGTTNQSSSFPTGSTFGTNLVVLGTVWDSTNSRFFIRVKTTADLTQSATGTANYKSVYYVTSAGVLSRYGLDATKSGTTAPSGSGLFFNTSTNKVSVYSSGSISTDNVSVPIAIGTTNSSGANGTIDQTFNGLGYIGAVVWLDKGVKTLKPNGRNTDGTLNNTESTTTGVSLINLSSASDGVRSILLDGPGNFTHTGSSIQYNPDTNYYMASSPTAKYCVLGKVTISSGTISLAVFKNVLSINDLIDGQWVSSYTEIARDVAAPTSSATSYSLASYLPNDGYNYEVILRGFVQTASTSGAMAVLTVASSIIYNADYFPAICTAQTRAANYVISRGSITLPVGKDRTIYVGKHPDNNGVFTLLALGYRRIGRND